MTDSAENAVAAEKDEKNSSTSSSLFDKFKDKIDTASLIDKAKGKIDDVFHYAGETHGKRDDIDEKTALDDVKAPNVFGRVKEEFEALVETVSAKSDEITSEVKNKFIAISGDSKGDEKNSKPIKIEEGTQLHHKETHGTSNDINEDTPIDAVKAPSVYQRAKEEIEALVGTIHPKKETSQNTEESGFRSFIAKLLEKICHPWNSKKEESKSD